MTQLTLSKSTYLKEQKKLDNYERYLPSLELKRKQLIVEKNKADQKLQKLQNTYDLHMHQSGETLQMLSNDEIALERMVSVKASSIVSENIVGVALPKVDSIDIEVKPYGYLTKPHWVDVYVERLKQACELHITLQIQKQRCDILHQAARKAAQRVNLVGEVLIPEVKANMRKISIFLGDNERAAVVRSKLAKRKKVVMSE